MPPDGCPARPDEDGQKSALGGQSQRCRGVVDQRQSLQHRLIPSPRGDHELYNLNDDPGEQQNLIGRPEHRAVIRELWERLIAWQKRTNDPVAFSHVEARKWSETT